MKTCSRPPARLGFLAIFRGKLPVAILLLVVGVTPTGNRDAGKFAADATQLPTGCQPESLAKPARRCSHKPQRVYRRPREKARSGRGRGLEFRGSNSTKRVSVVRPFYGAFLVGRLTLISASMLRHTASRRRVRLLWPVQ